MSKKCPHCGGTTFKAVIRRAGAINLEKDGTASIIKELTKFSYEVIECLTCKKGVRNDMLVDKTPCAKCGTLTESKDLNEKGLCPVCQALELHPELAKASQQDLIKMLLDVEKKLKANKSAKIDDKIEKANTQVRKANAKSKDSEIVAKVNDKQQAIKSESKQKISPDKQELTPQQKAAQTRKINAEKKRMEQEALNKVTNTNNKDTKASSTAQQSNDNIEANSDLPMGDDLPIDNIGELPMDDNFQYPEFGPEAF